MINVRKLLLSLALLSFMILPSVGFAQSFCYDRTVSSQYSVGMGQKNISDVVEQKICIEGLLMRVEEKKTGKLKILRIDRKVRYEINIHRKTFTETNLSDLDIAPKGSMQSTMVDPQRNIGMQSAREQMLKSLSGAGSQGNLQMQMMLKNQARMMTASKPQNEEGGNVPVALKWTEKTKIVNGYNCTRFKVIKGKKRLYEGWVTTKIGPQNYYTDFVPYSEIFNKDVIAALKKVNGFPMLERYRVQTGQSAGALQSVKVTRFEKRRMPYSEYEIPTGFVREGSIGGAPGMPMDDDDDDGW